MKKKKNTEKSDKIVKKELLCNPLPKKWSANWGEIRQIFYCLLKAKEKQSNMKQYFIGGCVTLANYALNMKRIIKSEYFYKPDKARLTNPALKQDQYQSLGSVFMPSGFV